MKLNPIYLLFRLGWRFCRLVVSLLLRILTLKRIAHSPTTTMIVVETAEDENDT